MFGMPNSHGILLVFVIDIVLAITLGWIIDSSGNNIHPDYQDTLGCALTAPIFLILNMVGLAILVFFDAVGLLGPWWSWVVGIAVPYLLIYGIIWSAGQVEKRY